MPGAINEVTLGKEAISSKSAHTQYQYDDDNDEEEEEEEKDENYHEERKNTEAKVPKHTISFNVALANTIICKTKLR